MTTIQRLKTPEDLNLALAVIEQILENPQNVKSKIGSHCGAQDADISGPLIAAALDMGDVYEIPSDIFDQWLSNLARKPP